MGMAANIIIVIVGLLHVYFLVLEMFLWAKPLGLKTFRNTPEKAEITKVLAANQGLYNGFLASGLLWSVFAPSPRPAIQLRMFFLCCVSVAGIFGGITVRPTLFFVQGLPALITLALVLVSSKSASSASPS